MTTLPRETDVEETLKWARRQGYSFSLLALDRYCRARGLGWKEDYNGVIDIVSKQPGKFVIKGHDKVLSETYTVDGTYDTREKAQADCRSNEWVEEIS